MLTTIVQSHKHLSNFLEMFRHAFKNRPQFFHFQAYVLGLIIYLGPRNLAGLNRAVPGAKSASSLYRFIADMDWDQKQVAQVRWEMLNRRTRRALQAIGRRGEKVPVFLAIDDSLVEKTGKKIAGVDYHYSHSSGRTTLGHVWVTGQLIVLGQSYPIQWKLYRRRKTCEALDVTFSSKPELASQILRDFKPLPKTRTYVLTDSWYPSQALLALCQELGFQLISAVKSDRKFTATGHSLQVKQWSQILPKRAFDLVTVNTACYKAWSTKGRLSSGHRVRLVINRVIGQKKWRYLISTDQALSVKTILSYYLNRWEVENFYRVAKQSLGWADYQMRDLFAIERHVLLMMVAHAYLETRRQDMLAEAEPGTWLTLGEIQREHRVDTRRVEIAQVFDLTKRGFELDTIYHHLAA